MNSILIVDDCPEDTSILRNNLAAIGVTNPVLGVACCAEAVDYLTGHGQFSDRVKYPLPRVVFLDLKFPGMDGFEFLKWIKDRYEFRHILVIAVSGYDDLHSVRRAYEGGANSFVAKPCGCDELRNLVEGFPGPWERK